jgi:protease I
MVIRRTRKLARFNLFDFACILKELALNYAWRCFMEKSLKDIKVAVLLCNGFEEVEMTKPVAALKKAGATVHLITPKGNTVRAWNHDHWTKKYPIDVKLSNAKASTYDALVLPGGVMNPDTLRTSKSAVKFVDSFLKNNKLVAAICHGPLTLIETKKLKKRTMTSYHSIKADIKNAGANWQNKKVVIDGNLITSRQPKDISAFNKAIIKACAKIK